MGQKFSDDEIRQLLETEGRTLADWFANEEMYYFCDKYGKEFVVMDDNDHRATAVINYLLRNGRRREIDSKPAT